MDIGNQIKKYCNINNLSQEQLADKLYVTRQTISNWENGKSYPDIHSLVLMSTIFNVSVDDLTKGDLKIMKEEIAKDDIKTVKRSGLILSILLIIEVLFFVPVVFYFDFYGFLFIIPIAIFAFYYNIKLEFFRNKYNLTTYQEITSFLKDKTLDEIDRKREIESKNKFIYKSILITSASIFSLIAILILELKFLTWLEK